MTRILLALRREKMISGAFVALTLLFTSGCGSSNRSTPSLSSDPSGSGAGLGGFNFPTTPTTPGVGSGTGSKAPSDPSGPGGATGMSPPISGSTGQEPPELSSTIAGATSPESLRTPQGLSAFLQQNFQRITGRPYGQSIADYFNQIALQVPALQDALSQLYCDSQFANQDRAFVRGLYESTLNRFPSPQEIQGWVNQLRSGQNRTQVARGFLNSQEFRRNLVVSYYVRYLNRFPAESEIQYWVGQLNAGMRVEDVQRGFLASREFYQQNGSNVGQFVNALYAYQLGRAAEPSGWQFWVNFLLQRGGSDNDNARIEAANGFIQSDENRHNVVAWMYLNYLGRVPEPGAYAYWVPFLAANGLIETAAGILGSDEYYNKQVFRGINWVNQLCD